MFNGEVYNFAEERQKLESEGYVFKSKTDTEVVLNLFKKYKEKCVDYLRGMFAFAIWDRDSRSLFIARDHMGIKPLLFSFYKGFLVFASEMKAILASGLVEPILCKKGLSVFLQKGFVPPPFSIINNVYCLNPGHTLTYKEGLEPEIKPYWDIQKTGNTGAETYEQAVAGVRSRVLQAVEEELVSDVPLGVFLSGGLDSTVIVAAMREVGEKRIDTFSLGFEDSNLDETHDAFASATYFKTNHHKIIVGGETIAKDFDEFVYGLDQPSVDGLNSFFVSKAARKQVTVALSGLGGDELFIGYSWQHRYFKNHGLLSLSGSVLAPFEDILSASGTTARKIAAKLITPSSVEIYYKALHSLFRPGELEEMLVPDAGFSKKDHIRLVEKTIAQYPVKKNITRLQAISKMDMRYFMCGRLLRDSDAVSMINSLEVRFPLIDHRLVTYVWNLPDRFKIRHNLSSSELNKGFERTLSYEEGQVKQLLFDAFKKILPPDMQARSKRGFKMPFEKWMRNDLKQQVYEGIMGLGGEILTREAANNIYTAWNRGCIGWQSVWSLMVLQSWMKQNKVQA